SASNPHGFIDPTRRHPQLRQQFDRISRDVKHKITQPFSSKGIRRNFRARWAVKDFEKKRDDRWVLLHVICEFQSYRIRGAAGLSEVKLLQPGRRRQYAAHILWKREVLRFAVKIQNPQVSQSRVVPRKGDVLKTELQERTTIRKTSYPNARQVDGSQRVALPNRYKPEPR
ncbi:hypothetical protein FRB90_008280, partial [Tulasnella sp. 427]